MTEAAMPRPSTRDARSDDHICRYDRCQALAHSGKAYGADLSVGVFVAFALVLTAGLTDFVWGGFQPGTPVPTVCVTLSIISVPAIFVLWAGICLTHAIAIAILLIGRRTCAAMTLSLVADRLTLTASVLHHGGGFLCGAILGSLAALWVLTCLTGVQIARGDIELSLLVLLAVSALLIGGRFFLGNLPPLC